VVFSRALALRVDADDAEPQVRWIDGETGALHRTVARQLVCATPSFVTRYLIPRAGEHLNAFHYTPWVIANLTLKSRPHTRGFPQAWDNVLYDSSSLGYVDSAFQLGRDRGATVWTWYMPLCGPDPKALRRSLLLAPYEQWRDAIAADLFRAHQGLDELVESADVWRWGHAMIRPEVGFVRSDGLRQARRPIGAVHFAHTDLSGLALFEEAFDHGVRAAEEVLASLGVKAESLRE